MEHVTSLLLGIVVERRELANRWQRYAWRPVEVIPNGPRAEEWRLLAEAPGLSRWYAGALALELHRGETAAYRTNLASAPPMIYCVLRPVGNVPGDRAMRPFLVTAAPFEAEEYLVGGDEIVEGVPMPPEVVAWVRDFVARHHVDTPFVKRRRTRGDDPTGRFGGGHG